MGKRRAKPHVPPPAVRRVIKQFGTRKALAA